MCSRRFASSSRRFVEGAGPDVDILVDLNFNYKTEGYLQASRGPWSRSTCSGSRWTFATRGALHYIRSRTTIPVASGESLFGRREYRPFFEQGSMDSVIIDLPWNGLAESLKIAAMADAYDVNVAPHNFYSPLATMMSMHLCAVAPNVRIMETDVDQAPWVDDLVTVKPDIRDGYVYLPTGPGWGTEINEEAVRAHPALAR